MASKMIKAALAAAVAVDLEVLRSHSTWEEWTTKIWNPLRGWSCRFLGRFDLPPVIWLRSLLGGNWLLSAWPQLPDPRGYTMGGMLAFCNTEVSYVSLAWPSKCVRLHFVNSPLLLLPFQTYVVLCQQGRPCLFVHNDLWGGTLYVKSQCYKESEKENGIGEFRAVNYSSLRKNNIRRATVL